jgi:hypothetical protein
MLSYPIRVSNAACSVGQPLEVESHEAKNSLELIIDRDF